MTCRGWGSHKVRNLYPLRGQMIAAPSAIIPDRATMSHGRPGRRCCKGHVRPFAAQPAQIALMQGINDDPKFNDDVDGQLKEALDAFKSSSAW